MQVFTLRVLSPKYTSNAMPKYCPIGAVLWNWSGTFEKIMPMPTEINVMKDRAATEPAKLSSFPTFMASSAAMKKVLSPSSDRNMRVNAARHPDLPSGELATYSCTAQQQEHCRKFWKAGCLQLTFAC